MFHRSYASRQVFFANSDRGMQIARLLFVAVFGVSLAACSNSGKKNKSPEFTSAAAISVPEGTTATGYTAIATDPNGRDTVTFSISGGADQAQFNIDATSGVLTFVTAPEFINPADANGDNVYEVQLTADDGRGKNNTATLDLSVTVTSVNQPPAFTSANAVNTTEGSTATGYTATASDPNADALTFSISGGADAALFSIDADTGVLSFLAAPVFAAPADANTDNDYEVQLTVNDGRTGTDTLDLVVTVLEMSNFSLELTFPTSGANLGGSATVTTVTGNIVDSNGLPIDLADIDYVDVNGVMAVLDAGDPGRWSAQVPVAAGTNTLDLELGLTSGTVVNQSHDIHNFRIFPSFRKMGLDVAADRLLVIDAFLDGVVSIDLTSGSKTVLSGDGVGVGTAFNSPRDVALDSGNNRILVPDWQLDALLAVDTTSGDRTVLSNSSTGAGVALDGPNAVALDSANNRALVIVSITNEIIAVDLATGDRSVFSGVGVGAGPDFAFPDDLVIDSANNRVLVLDDGLEALLDVDLTTGDRSIIADAGTGTGPDVTGGTLALDAANGRVLAALFGSELLEIDLATGNRTLIAETETDFGPNGTQFGGVALDSANSRALVTDSDVDAVFAFDLTSGARSILTDSGTGSGPSIASLQRGNGLALDSSNERLLFANSNGLSITTIALANGDRAVLSDIGNTPQGVTVDAATDRAVALTGSAFYEVDLADGNLTLVSSNSGPGSGPNFSFITRVAADFANNEAMVLDSAAVVRVATDTGDRSVVSDSSTGAGPVWTNVRGLAVDFPADVAYVADLGTDAVFVVDTVTGNRSILSDNAGVGAGPNFGSLEDIEIDAAANRLLAVDSGFGSRGIVTVDLSTGDRTIIWDSNAINFLSPGDLALDAANDRLFVYSGPLGGVVVIDLGTGEWAVMSK